MLKYVISCSLLLSASNFLWAEVEWLSPTFFSDNKAVSLAGYSALTAAALLIAGKGAQNFFAKPKKRAHRNMLYDSGVSIMGRLFAACSTIVGIGIASVSAALAYRNAQHAIQNDPFGVLFSQCKQYAIAKTLCAYTLCKNWFTENTGIKIWSIE